MTQPVFALLIIITTDNMYISHRNCGVTQGFPAMRKAVTTRVKKYRIFSRVLIYPISLPHLMLIHPFHLSSAFSKGPACSPPRVFLSFLKRISTYLQYTYKNECLICSQQQKFHSPCEDHLLRRLLNIKERKSVCRDIKR